MLMNINLSTQDIQKYVDLYSGILDVGLSNYSELSNQIIWGYLDDYNKGTIIRESKKNEDEEVKADSTEEIEKKKVTSVEVDKEGKPVNEVKEKTEQNNVVLESGSEKVVNTNYDKKEVKEDIVVEKGIEPDKKVVVDNFRINKPENNVVEKITDKKENVKKDEKILKSSKNEKLKTSTESTRKNKSRLDFDNVQKNSNLKNRELREQKKQVNKQVVKEVKVKPKQKIIVTKDEIKRYIRENQKQGVTIDNITKTYGYDGKKLVQKMLSIGVVVQKHGKLYC